MASKWVRVRVYTQKLRRKKEKERKERDDENKEFKDSSATHIVQQNVLQRLSYNRNAKTTFFSSQQDT